MEDCCILPFNDHTNENISKEKQNNNNNNKEITMEENTVFGSQSNYVTFQCDSNIFSQQGHPTWIHFVKKMRRILASPA